MLLNSTSRMDDVAVSTPAQRTCVQCKSSKKKCTKELPKCSRCLRLALECSYNEGEKPTNRGNESVSSESRFDEVFQRLQRLETHVFSSGHAKDCPAPVPHDVPSNGHSEKQNEKAITHDNWAVMPGYMKISHMALVLFGTLTSAFGECDTSMEAVVCQYFKTVGTWLPMIWQAKIEEQVAKFRDLESTSKFHLQCFAMLVLSSPLPVQQAQDPSEHPWYRACKYFFVNFIALGNPCVEYVQAGMLLAIFEHVQCVEDRAPTTLGMCIRVAYDLGWDDVLAKASSLKPGELTPQHEEIFLTWWGLQRLERYFNMPPTGRMKPLFMPLQHETDSINGRKYPGPLITKFTIVNNDLVFASIHELEASRMLGQVQIFIRNNRSAPFSSIAQSSSTLLNTIEEYLTILRIHLHNDVVWAGVAVTLDAALELQLFVLNKQETIDMNTLRSTHSILTQINDVFLHCRVVNGFTEDYMEGSQPTWFSIAYHALIGYNTIQTLDVQSTLPAIEFDIGLEILNTLSRRYKLPGKTFTSSPSHTSLNHFTTI